ncbi:MAG: hypothetical protein KDA63_05550, partial [Planctomycetales bacterium]|nr:hypothetical protein [Planctomycetales bacterium]
DFGGGEVVLGFDVGDTGSFTHSGGAVNVDRGFIVGFGGTGQLVLAGSSGTVPTPSFNVGGDLSFGAAQFAQLGTGSLVARLNANPITPVSVNGTNSDGFFFGDLVINDGSEFSLQVADGFRPHFGPNQGTETLVNYVGTRTGDGTAKFTEVAARAEWGIDYSLVYDNAGKKVDVNLDYVFAAGDTDFDKDFDTTDRNNMAAKFNAGPVGATFSQGDFNNDEQVDLADAQLALGSGVYNAGPYEGLTPPTTPIGMATLTYDVLTGNLSLDADGNTLSSFRILSQSDAFTAASASLPAGTFSTDADGEIGVAFAAITGTTDLGDVVGLPGPGDPLADLLFTYTVAGVAGIFQGDILLAGALAGDANGDGWVDGLDYLVWAANFDTVGPPDPAVADGNFNGDSAVDGLDYLVWASNFGSHSAATAVPEPSAAMLVSLAALATAVLPVRRRVAERV